MGIIALPNIPPKGPGAGIQWELRSNSARFPALSGYTRTLERGGSHFAATLRYENLNTSEAARMRAFLSTCRGQAQRFYLRDFGYTKRGSFAAPELLTNNYFASGTTGWAGYNGTLTAADGILRSAYDGSAGLEWGVRKDSITVTQYAPYALRAQFAGSKIGSTAVYKTEIGDGAVGSLVALSALGLGTVARVALGTTFSVFGYQDGTVGEIVGNYVDLSYMSLARCALVDNGPNDLTFSDQINNAAWTKAGATATTNTYTAPDGTVTGDGLVEDTSTGNHQTFQNTANLGAATDCVAFAMLRQTTPARDATIFVGSSAAAGYAFADFNLSTGATSGVGTSGTATNARAFSAPMGGGWYACWVIARLPSGVPNGIMIRLLSGGSGSYTGTTGEIGVWRAGCAASSVPTRGMQTTTTADTDGTSQTGSALYLKGLPASTNGLLLADDLAEIITPSGSQFVRSIAPLNTDAAGLGYWQFEPPLRESPADNAGVIICNPLMRAMLDDRTVRWTQRHAGFVDLEFTAVEDMTA